MFYHDFPTPIVETTTPATATETEEVYVFREVSQEIRDQGTVDWVEGTYDNKGLPFLRKREKGKYHCTDFGDSNIVELPKPVVRETIPKGKDSNVTFFTGKILPVPDETAKEKPVIPPDIPFQEYVQFFQSIIDEEIDKKGIFPDKSKMNNVFEWVDGVQLVDGMPKDNVSSADSLRMEPSLLYSFEGRVATAFDKSYSKSYLKEMQHHIDNSICGSAEIAARQRDAFVKSRDNIQSVNLPTVEWDTVEKKFFVYAHEVGNVLKEVDFSSFKSRRVTKPLEFRGMWGGVPFRFLLDTGATTNVVSSEFAKLNKTGCMSLKKPLNCTFANGSSTTIKLETVEQLLSVNGESVLFSGVVCDIPGYDAIVGLAWLEQHKALLSFDSPLTLTFRNRNKADGSPVEWVAYDREEGPTTKEEFNFISVAETEEEMIEALTDKNKNAEYFVINFKDLGIIPDVEVNSSEADPTVPPDTVPPDKVPVEPVKSKVRVDFEKEFEDIITDKAPTDLPTKRNLGTPEHNINLDPSAEIPRFSGYVTSFGASEIMKDMIKGFVDRG